MGWTRDLSWQDTVQSCKASVRSSEPIIIKGGSATGRRQHGRTVQQWAHRRFWHGSPRALVLTHGPCQSLNRRLPMGGELGRPRPATLRDALPFGRRDRQVGAARRARRGRPGHRPGVGASGLCLCPPATGLRAPHPLPLARPWQRCRGQSVIFVTGHIFSTPLLCQVRITTATADPGCCTVQRSLVYVVPLDRPLLSLVPSLFLPSSRLERPCRGVTCRSRPAHSSQRSLDSPGL
jgi:hypothetical protein